MREAWGRGGFGCRCTGAVLDDPWSPWSLDRRGMPGPSSSPRGGGMKTALSGGELGKVVGELDRHWREGGEFDRGVVGFEHWSQVAGHECRTVSERRINYITLPGIIQTYTGGP